MKYKVLVDTVCKYCGDDGSRDILAKWSREELRNIGWSEDDIITSEEEYIMDIRSGGNLLEVMPADEQCIDSALMTLKINFCPMCGRELEV